VERASHEVFGRERGDARFFQGRGAALQAILDYARAAAGRVLLVVGETGMGKTALLARAALEAAARHPASQVIVRFLGATAASTERRGLLQSLCRELAERVGQDDYRPPEELPALADDFAEFLTQARPDRPLVVFLDALDQLADDATAETRLGWLPARLPPHAALVVSSLPGVADRTPAGQVLALPPLAPDEGRDLLDAWLAAAGRTLQEHQRRAVLARFEACPRPLYLKLAFEQARHWRAFDLAPDLGSDLPAVVGGLFDRLADEASHGARLVERSLALVAAARPGLSEDEPIDLLGRDAEVMEDFRRRSAQPGLDDRLPVVVWSRLYFDLKPYLAERRAGGARLLTFYHRAIGEAVTARYLAGGDRALRHGHLADYYAAQPDFFEAPGQPRRPNARKAAELPAQLLGAGRPEALAATLLTPGFLEAKAEAGLVFDLVADFARAAEQLPPMHPRRPALRLLEEALQRDVHFLARHPEALFQCLWNSCWWHDCAAAAAHRAALGPHPAGAPVLAPLLEAWRATKEQAAPGFCWARALRPPPEPLGAARALLLAGHEEGVNCVHFTPDGRRLLSAANDGTARVWDAASGQELACLVGHRERVSDLACSPDGRLLASASNDGTVRVWDWGAGLELHQHKVPSGSATPLAFSPDGRHLLAAAEGVKCWDAHSGEAVATFLVAGRKGAFSADGRQLAIATWGETDGHVIRVFDLARGAEVAACRGHTDQVEALAFAPDGARLASASFDKTVRVWDAATGAATAVLRGHDHWVLGVAFAPDGRRLVSGSWDQTARVWDAATGRELACLAGHQKQVYAVAFSPDGSRVATGSSDQTVRVWDAEGTPAPAPPREHPERVVGLAFLPGGHHLISNARYERGAWAWEVERGLPLAVIPHARAVLRVACAGGRLATSSRDGHLRVWDAATGQLVCELGGHQVEEDLGVALAPDGRALASWGDWSDHTVRVWDLEEGALRFELPELRVRAVAFSPDGRLFAAGQQGERVHVWDARTGQEVAAFGAFEAGEAVQCVAFSPDGRRLAAGVSMSVRLWDLAGGAEVLCGKRSDGDVLALAFSPDGGRLFAQADWPTAQKTGWAEARVPTVQVWETAGLTRPVVLKGRTDVDALARGAPCCVLAGAVETAVETWPGGSPLTRLPVKAGLVCADPSGRVWAGASGKHVWLFRLEGDLTAVRPPAAETGPPGAGEFHFPRRARHTRRAAGDRAGLVWQNDSYVCHEAVCPVCGTGEPFGSGDYQTELRVYFDSGPPRTTDRPITAMRIKCGGPVAHAADRDLSCCGVGTGDVSGLYLLPARDPAWPRQRARAYLKALSSPFADHPSLTAIPDRDWVARDP
jgi:WD40 repeat protein